MGWQHRPSLIGGPKATEAGILLLHPCYPRSCPSYPWGPWMTFVAYSPFEELTRLPPGPDLASSFSGWAWPTGQGQ